MRGVATTMTSRLQFAVRPGSRVEKKLRQESTIGGHFKKRLCVFLLLLLFFGLTSFYLSVFTSFWYQIIALFKSFLMVCFIRV